MDRRLANWALLGILAALLATLANGLDHLTSLRPWSSSPLRRSLLLRAGAKRVGASRASRGKASVKDDDDDDDDEDDDEDIRNKMDSDDGGDSDDDGSRSKGKASKRKAGKGSGGRSKRGGKGSSGGRKSGKKRGGNRRARNQLIKWGETYGKASAGLREGLREKLEELAKQGQTAYKDVYRRAKVLRSSAFEAMLLRATWPGDDPVPQELLDEIIKHSIPAFKYGRSSAEDDPYHMTLHKLWTKMSEKDWRTVVKSLYIVHCVSRDCSVDACNRFALAIKDMSKVRNPKSPDHKYFDLALIKEVDDASAPYESFLSSYSAYVLYRAKTFSNKFEEIKEISDQTHEKQAVARLKRAQQCITNGLKCTVEDRDQQNLITGHATRQICNDLRDCWKHFTAKLAPLAAVEGVAPYGGAKAEEKDIISLLQFYRDTGKDVKAFLARALKSYGPLRVKIPAEIETKFLPPADFEEKLAARAALLTVSSPPQGGATPSPAGKKGGSSKRPADLEDEEEDDEEDEDEDEDEEDDDDVADGDDETDDDDDDDGDEDEDSDDSQDDEEEKKGKDKDEDEDEDQD